MSLSTLLSLLNEGDFGLLRSCRCGAVFVRFPSGNLYGCPDSCGQSKAMQASHVIKTPEVAKLYEIAAVLAELPRDGRPQVEALLEVVESDRFQDDYQMRVCLRALASRDTVATVAIGKHRIYDVSVTDGATSKPLGGKWTRKPLRRQSLDDLGADCIIAWTDEYGAMVPYVFSKKCSKEK